MEIVTDEDDYKPRPNHIMAAKQFPIEVVERILSYCDGHTLYNAAHVNEDWRQAVLYITKQPYVWKKICKADIPSAELPEYISSYNGFERDKWLCIFDNYRLWCDMRRNVEMMVIRVPINIPRISCLAIKKNFLVVGTDSGRVLVFTLALKLVDTVHVCAVRVENVTIILDDDASDYTFPSLVINHKNGTMVIYDTNSSEEAVTIREVSHSSVHNNLIGYVKLRDRLSVCRYAYDPELKMKTLFELTYVRLYSPQYLSGMKIWNDMCVVITNNKVKVLAIDQRLPPVAQVVTKYSLNCLTKASDDPMDTHAIFRNDVIIRISDIYNFELFILDEERVSKLMFDTNMCLTCEITSMLLYGNIFVMGAQTGMVYFYNITSWKKFNPKNYCKRVIIGRHPIIGIQVVESRGERNFFVTSSFQIHKIHSYTVSELVQ